MLFIKIIGVYIIYNVYIIFLGGGGVREISKAKKAQTNVALENSN